MFIMIDINKAVSIQTTRDIYSKLQAKSAL